MQLLTPLDNPKSRWLSPRAWRLLTGGLIILTPFGVFGAYHAAGWFQDTTRLNRVLAQTETADPGWRIQDLEAHRADVPEDQNGALHVLEASKLLSRPLPTDSAWIEAEDVPILMQASAPQIGRLRAEMHNNAAALAEANKLADLPRGRYPNTWTRDVHERNPPHMQVSRDVLWLLHCDLLLHAAEGDLDAALVTVRAAWNTARSFGDEPFLPSQRERLSCRSITLLNLEHVLGQGQPSSEALLGLIPSLLEEDREPLVLIGWRGERATLYELMEAHHAGEIKNQTSVELSRRDVEARSMELMTQMIEIAKWPPGDQRPRIQEVVSDVLAEAGDNSSLMAVNAKVNLENLLSFRGYFLRQQARLRCCVLALAAEHYRRTHDGRWPAKLADLSPDPLAQLPTDPYDGNPLRFSIQDQSVVIYSIGPDLVDDGGRIDHPNPFLHTDIGIRLWNVDKRRLPPGTTLPQPHFPD